MVCINIYQFYYGWEDKKTFKKEFYGKNLLIL